MSVRNLGDWSPLDQDKDPVRADPEKIESARKQYAHIASTIKDASATLQKIVDTGSDDLAGQYVKELRSKADDLKDKLGKAGVRYQDVADQIKIYQPHLQTALDETANELREAQGAKDEQTKAHSMPDGKKSPDGTFSKDEKEKVDAKNKAISEADDNLAAVKKKFNNTMNALNTAGKAFGDAVNCKNYDDGLTDSLKDKIDAVMSWIAKIFGYIGMALAALAILIPGVDLLVIGGLAAGAVTLVANVTLYANGDGSLFDVIFGAVGLGLGGIGMGLGAISKSLGSIGEEISADGKIGPPRLQFGDDFEGEPFAIKWGADGKPEWTGGGGTGNTTVTSVLPVDLTPPPPGIWAKFGNYLKGLPGNVGSGVLSVGTGKDLATVLQAIGLGKGPSAVLGTTWAGMNIGTNIVYGEVITGMENTGDPNWKTPPNPAFSPS